MNPAIPIAISDAVTATISRRAPAAITGFTAAHGGCINRGGRLHTTAGDFFLKWNTTASLERMFEVEARGLNLLRATQAIHVPEVVTTGQLSEYQFILLEYVPQQAPRNDYWALLGRQLAALHASRGAAYGLDHDNYIGSLPQRNSPTQSWRLFFAEKRLAPLLDQVSNLGIAPVYWRKAFENLYRNFDSLLPEEGPSLIHGDLWQGNVLVNGFGAPCLIDPAVYFGHREVDLAMTRLFGEFDESFYNAYQEAWPLQKGFEERFAIYNLYPLLVHLKLFGSSYIVPIQSTLDAFL
jgi:fructosamine-3-kinase